MKVTHLLLCLILLPLALIGEPKLSRPAQELLDGSLAFLDPLWDERAGLIWSPQPSAPGESRVHRVRESGWYALGLLARNGPGDNARAARIFDAVLEQQINEPGTPWHGTFYRFPEEHHIPLISEIWRDYDPNWRQFIGATFALAMIEFPERLSEDLKSRLMASIALALEGERGHGRLKPSYTNIALMHVFLGAYIGSQWQRTEWITEAEALAKEIAAEYDEHGTFEEYNSPTYYGVDFFGLALWRAHGATPLVRSLGERLEAALWRDTAAFYEPRFRNLCGPFDRAYGMDMRKYASLTGLWLRSVLDEEVAPFPPLGRPMGHAHDFAYAPSFILLGARIPEDALQHFVQSQGERTLKRHLPRGRVATAWIGEKVMMGGEFTAKGRGAGKVHNQFHPATIHWGLPNSDVGWVLLTESPRMDSRAEPGRLEVTGVGDFTFTVYCPGAVPQMVSSSLWKLPGLDLTVKTDALGFEVEPLSTGLRVKFKEATRIEFISLVNTP